MVHVFFLVGLFACVCTDGRVPRSVLLIGIQYLESKFPYYRYLITSHVTILRRTLSVVPHVILQTQRLSSVVDVGYTAFACGRLRISPRALQARSRRSLVSSIRSKHYL